MSTNAAAKRTTTTRARTASPAARPAAGAIAKRTPGRARSDASRVAILGAALKLLETTPLQQISIESIAREAGVGKATIYRWWSSKAAVVIEAFVQYHVSHTAIPKGMGPREVVGFCVVAKDKPALLAELGFNPRRFRDPEETPK